jgi:hypothetical protein
MREKRQYIYKFNSKNKKAAGIAGADNYMSGEYHGSN